ncbi:MAG: cation diffusion facilitator family transporter [Bdellovibrionales bacterium]
MSSHDHCNHGHNHANAPTNFGRSFLVAASLNAAFIIAEIVYGLKANSLALLADAGHNFGDVLGLLLAWGAWRLSKRAPSGRYTYGLRSSSIMAALVNVIVLLISTGIIAWEAVQRLGVHQQVDGNVVMWVAVLGILINGVTAWMFSKGQNDLNIKAAFMHLASDAAVSFGVVIAGLIITQTGWLWVDPVVSLAISIVIAWSSWGLLRDSANLALHAVPANIDHEKVRRYLAGLPGVKEVHDLHIWGMSTTEAALSAHLIFCGAHPGDDFLSELREKLRDDYSIGHVTIQIELGNGRTQCKTCA